MYKYLLILSINLLLAITSNLFAQSYDLNEVDIELRRIYRDDQQIRLKLNELTKASMELAELMVMISINDEMKLIDAKNQKYVSDLLDKYGWPNNLSDSANAAIFLVIDHGDKSYSEKYFEMVTEKANQGIISKSFAATLEDRILMRSNKPQKYGTQTKSSISNTNTENVIYIWPIQDPEKVDELRTSVELPPINTYIQMMGDILQMKVVWDKNLSVSDLAEQIP